MAQVLLVTMRMTEQQVYVAMVVQVRYLVILVLPLHTLVAEVAATMDRGMSQ